jgi:predicted nucleotidyltransferase
VSSEVMPQILPPLVQRTLHRLIRAFAPQQILLFGSWAKGTTHDRSDVDLLIVADLPGNASIHSRRARQLAADSFPRIDIVFATPEEVLTAQSAKSPFLASILSNSVVVYRRS